MHEYVHVHVHVQYSCPHRSRIISCHCVLSDAEQVKVKVNQ